MKKAIAFYLPAILAALVLTASPVKAEPNLEGDPMDNPNHFIWSVFAELQTPDDPDCQTVMVNALLSEGLTVEQATTPATMGCSNIAQMRTQMQSEMNGMEGESMETNLFDATNWHSVQNLYFQHSTDGIVDGRIAFSQPIDFMSYNFMQFMMNFGENMDSSQGRISLDADTVGGFANYGASLTMYNVPDYDDPVILVDGEEDNSGVVSNLTYDRENNTLTFSARHFSTFEAVEGSSLTARPRIQKIKAQAVTAPNGKKALKMIVSGKKFKKGVKVTLDNRDPFKLSRKSDNKIVVHFYLDKLEKTGRDTLTLRVINSSDKIKKYPKKIDWKSVGAKMKNL